MKHNFKHICILSMMFVFSLAFSQDDKKIPVIKSSSLGMGGGSKFMTLNNANFYLSQSIGQSSVIGTNINRNYTILQGYQLSSISIKMIPNIENDLKAIVYPNPFEESINISFDDNIKEEIIIQVYDMSGRLILMNKNPPSQILNIPLNNISIGVYNLIINSNNKQFVANIIKK